MAEVELFDDFSEIDSTFQDPPSSDSSEQEIDKIAAGLVSLDQQVVISTAKMLAKQDDPDLGRHQSIRQGLVRVLVHGSEAAKIWACHALCALGQSDPLTNIQLGRTPDLHPALRDVIRLQSRPVRLAACTALAALSEVQGVHSTAEAMASTPGMLEALVEVMRTEAKQGSEKTGDDVQVKDSAAMVLHNASNSERAAQLMLNTAGMLQALQDLSVGPRCKFWGTGSAEPEFTRASINAMCAINNLAKHPSVQRRMRETEGGFLDGLARLLQDVDSGRHLSCRKSGVDAGGAKAILVAALMSAAKLCKECELDEMNISSTEIASIIVCLRKGVSGDAWQGILWSVSDCVLPLLPLANCPRHRRTLAQCGVVPILLQVMARWTSRGSRDAVCTRSASRKRKRSTHVAGMGDDGLCVQTEAATCGGDISGREGARAIAAEDFARRWDDERNTAALCLLLTASMSVDETPHLLRTRSAITTLREVGRSLREEAGSNAREHTGIEVSTWPLRDRNLALCMGCHPRLGSDHRCLIRLLDESVLQMILELAATPAVLAFALAQALSHPDGHSTWHVPLA